MKTAFLRLFRIPPPYQGGVTHAFARGKDNPGYWARLYGKTDPQTAHCHPLTPCGPPRPPYAAIRAIWRPFWTYIPFPKARMAKAPGFGLFTTTVVTNWS